jgi:hypothetical protein
LSIGVIFSEFLLCQIHLFLFLQFP